MSDPLHGVTLKALLGALVERHGWDELGRRVPIRCFTNDPTLNSSLKFLRKTPWARAKVEALYVAETRHADRRRKQNARRAASRARAAETPNPTTVPSSTALKPSASAQAPAPDVEATQPPAADPIAAAGTENPKDAQ